MFNEKAFWRLALSFMVSTIVVYVAVLFGTLFYLVFPIGKEVTDLPVLQLYILGIWVFWVFFLVPRQWLPTSVGAKGVFIATPPAAGMAVVEMLPTACFYGMLLSSTLLMFHILTKISRKKLD